MNLQQGDILAPLYGRDGNMKSMGSVKASGDQSGSIFFYAPNTVYHNQHYEQTKLAKAIDNLIWEWIRLSYYKK